MKESSHNHLQLAIHYRSGDCFSFVSQAKGKLSASSSAIAHYTLDNSCLIRAQQVNCKDALISKAKNFPYNSEIMKSLNTGTLLVSFDDNP